MAKRNRKFRPLIQVVNGGTMLLAKAKSLVETGRGRIIAGRLHLMNPTDTGYDRARSFTRWSGAQSYDPELGGGPNVMQAHRTNQRRRGGSDGIQKFQFGPKKPTP